MGPIPTPASRPAPAPVPSLDRRLLFVTGKGGVGKTTVAAALALSLAAQNKRVLIAMCNAKERLSTMLGSDLIGPDVQPVRPNVWAVNIEPERAMEEYGLLTLKSKALYKLLFDNKYVRAFFRAVPGLHEWAMLGKAWWHTTETLPDGSPRFDVVIVDAPATGHGLDMLRVPKVITEIVPPGILRRDAEIAWAMFQDPERSGVVVVTLPEELPVTETLELAEALDRELRMPLARVVVNAVLPRLWDDEERASLESLPAPVAFSPPAEGKSAAETLLATGRMRAVRERVQAESIARLTRGLPLAPVFLPYILGDAATPASIQELARRLAPPA